MDTIVGNAGTRYKTTVVILRGSHAVDLIERRQDEFVGGRRPGHRGKPSVVTRSKRILCTSLVIAAAERVSSATPLAQSYPRDIPRIWRDGEAARDAKFGRYQRYLLLPRPRHREARPILIAIDGLASAYLFIVILSRLPKSPTASRKPAQVRRERALLALRRDQRTQIG